MANTPELIIIDKQNIVNIADALRGQLNSTEQMTFGEIADAINMLTTPATITYNGATKTLTITTEVV